MRSKHAIWVLCLHAIGLVLASTQFTVVSWVWVSRPWTFSYFQYSSANGWGYLYRSDYSLAVVLAYIVAYSLGIVAYGMARGAARAGWVAVALLLCALGLISFSIEASHWFWDHHLRWIATCPLASLLLAAVVAHQLWRAKGRFDRPGAVLGSAPPGATPESKG